MFIARKPKLQALVLFALCAAMLGGCSTGYYLQAGAGQLRIAVGKRPIDKLLNEQNLSPEDREILALSQSVLDFAEEVMLLPDNGSYRSYYDTGRRYVVWNVVAAPEFSLQPRTWCFPVAGCVAYRGYFNEKSADKFAAGLAEKGYDTYVRGVIAYSTLGRFHDPVLNTMLDLSEVEFVGLLLHELAHQKLYIKDDSAFNEGFASAVEQEGVRRWNAAINPAMSPAEDLDAARYDVVHTLLRDTRQKLERVFASELDAHAMRAEKRRVLDEMTVSYERLADQWRGEGSGRLPYSRFFAEGWNNASLAAVATYEDFVPAFDVLIKQCEQHLACFFERAEKISELQTEERHSELRGLMSQSMTTQKDLRQ